MGWPERVLRATAVQLAVALAYALAYRLQATLPTVIGTETASIVFIPAVIRVAATMLSGSQAVAGLFAGSLVVALQSLAEARSAISIRSW